jgi:hypothetical protein
VNLKELEAIRDEIADAVKDMTDAERELYDAGRAVVTMEVAVKLLSILEEKGSDHLMDISLLAIDLTRECIQLTRGRGV